jgi:hypothetical protein
LFPSIDLNGVPLWGFTYRLLTDSLLETGREPGQSEAARVLEFLLSTGLRQTGPCTVNGPIPVVAVLRHFAAPGTSLPRINMLHVEPDAVTILGPTFEEWTIRSA